MFAVHTQSSIRCPGRILGHAYVIAEPRTRIARIY
jgi:hypothetical protein